MRRPLRTDESYNEYVKDFYRKIEDYDWNEVTDHIRGLESFLHRFREKKIKELIKKFGRGDRYLDVGCGTGLILRHLPAGAVGIDLNPRHLTRAARYAPQAHVREGDIERLSLPDNSFSTAIGTEVLEHLVHPEEAVAGIWRVLEPGGVFIGSTPRHSLIWRFRFLSSTHNHNEPFHNEFQMEELQQLFSKFKTLLLSTGFFKGQFFFVLQKH